MITTLDLDANYKVEGWEGIAWYPLGYASIAEEVAEYDEDGELISLEYEINEDTSRVRMVMVGDDREFTFGLDEIEVLPEGSFCNTCGQIGCGHNV